MRHTAYIVSVMLFASLATGCFNKEVKEMPSRTTTIEHRSSVDVPSVESDVVHKRTTVESNY